MSALILPARDIVLPSNGLIVRAAAFRAPISHYRVRGSRILDRISIAPAGAWSVSEVLRAAYWGSPLLRVRREDTDAEQDIGHDEYGNLDRRAVESFCSGTNGVVSRVYGQDLGGKLLSQPTEASMPKLWDSATGLVTAGTNALPALRFNGTTNRLTRSDAMGFTGNPSFTVFRQAQLDGSIVSDRFSFSFGPATLSVGNGFAPMYQGATNSPSVSFLGKSVTYTTAVPPNVAATTWQSNMYTRAAGSDLQSTTMWTNGRRLGYVTSSNPTDTPNMTNLFTSWGDGVGLGAGYMAGLSNNPIVWPAVLNDADKATLDAWAALRG